MGVLTKHIMVENLSYEIINKRCLVTIDDAAKRNYPDNNLVKLILYFLMRSQCQVKLVDNVLDLAF